MILLQAGIERAEEGGRVLRAHALAVLAPQDPAILPGERHHLVRDLADERLLRRVGHVDGGADMEHAGIDMAEHAVDEAAAVEGGAELGDVVGQVLRRHGRVLDEGDGAAAARHVAEQPHRLLAHAPDALHGLHGERGLELGSILLGLIAILGDAQAVPDTARKGSPVASHLLVSRYREAAASVRAAFMLQHGRDAPKLGLELVRIVGQQLDQVDARGRTFRIVGEELRTSCQTMSLRARPSTRESTVSIEAACMTTRARASRKAASKLS